MLKKAERINRALDDDEATLGIACNNIAACKEELGDLEGALASAMEASRILSKCTAAGFVEQAACAASKIRRLHAARKRDTQGLGILSPI